MKTEPENISKNIEQQKLHLQWARKIFSIEWKKNTHTEQEWFFFLYGREKAH